MLTPQRGDPLVGVEASFGNELLRQPIRQRRSQPRDDVAVAALQRRVPGGIVGSAPLGEDRLWPAGGRRPYGVMRDIEDGGPAVAAVCEEETARGPGFRAGDAQRHR